MSDKGIPRKVVYVPSCVTRMMGPSKSDTEQASVHQKMLSLFEKAGYEVVYPEVGMGCSASLWLPDMHCSTCRVWQAVLWCRSSCADMPVLQTLFALPWRPCWASHAALHIHLSWGALTGRVLPRGMWAADNS